MGISLNIPESVRIIFLFIKNTKIFKEPSKLTEWGIKYESDNFKPKKDGTWKFISR